MSPQPNNSYRQCYLEFIFAALEDSWSESWRPLLTLWSSCRASCFLAQDWLSFGKLALALIECHSIRSLWLLATWSAWHCFNRPHDAHFSTGSTDFTYPSP